MKKALSVNYKNILFMKNKDAWNKKKNKKNIDIK